MQYGYDALDRLTAVGYNNNSPSYTYAYDAMGRLGRVIDLVGNSRTRYTYDDTGRLLVRTDAGEEKALCSGEFSTRMSF